MGRRPPALVSVTLLLASSACGTDVPRPDPTMDAGPAVALDGGSSDAGPMDAGGERPTLTAVTLNTHSFQEGADSLDKLRWIGDGLVRLGADVVALNEVMRGTFWSYDYGGASYDGGAIIQMAMEGASGAPWFIATSGFAHWDTGEEMANVILSRTPIAESDHRALTTTDFWPGPAEQRQVLYVRTEVPGFGPVALFATHTWGWDSADTLVQIDEARAFVREKLRGDEQVVLVMGDLNISPDSEAHTRWLGEPPLALVDTQLVADAAADAHPTVFDGDARIDYVLAWTAFEPRFASGRVFDGQPTSDPPLPVVSDHMGVRTVLSRAP